VTESTEQFLQRVTRAVAVERIADLLFVRFLVEKEDGLKAAEMIYDMITKTHGRGNG
jgi:hypothetical protein